MNSEFLNGIWPKTALCQPPAPSGDGLPHPDPPRLRAKAVCLLLNVRYLALGYVGLSERGRTQVLSWRCSQSNGKTVTAAR